MRWLKGKGRGRSIDEVILSFTWPRKKLWGGKFGDEEEVLCETFEVVFLVGGGDER